jgi:hypothetical protein
MSGNQSFIFDHPIICKTVKYNDQLDNISQCVHCLIPQDLVGSLPIGQF